MKDLGNKRDRNCLIVACSMCAVFVRMNLPTATPSASTAHPLTDTLENGHENWICKLADQNFDSSTCVYVCVLAWIMHHQVSQNCEDCDDSPRQRHQQPLPARSFVWAAARSR